MCKLTIRDLNSVTAICYNLICDDRIHVCFIKKASDSKQKEFQPVLGAFNKEN